MQSAKVFTWDTGNSTGEMTGHAKRITTCSFKTSRPFRIMTGGEDFKTVVYAGPPFKFEHSNSSHTNFVNGVRYSPNGERAVSVSSDKKIQLYDGKTGQPTTEISDAHTASIYSVSFTADSSKFATCSADKTIKVWDAATLACEHVFAPVDPAQAQVGDMQVAVAVSSPLIISLSLNGNINYFDPASGSPAPVRVVQGHQVAITAFAVDRETDTIYTGSYDGVVCATNATTGQCQRIVGTDNRNISGAAHAGKVSGVAVSGGALLTIGWDDALRTADVASGRYRSDSSTNGQPTGIATSGDITALVTNAEISVFRGEERVAVLPVSYGPTCVSLLGGAEMAVGGSDNKTHIYAIGEGALSEISTIETRSKVSVVSYSPLGDCLAIGDEGRQVEVYERGSWAIRVKGQWVNHTSRITCLAWSPNGSRLASGSLDENIYIWDAVNIQNRKQLPLTHASGVTGLGWMDEERLVSSGNDHVIVTWRIPIGA
jgi:WD repeat-containing protein 1 (actin-interacting protein 1)